MFSRSGERGPVIRLQLSALKKTKTKTKKQTTQVALKLGNLKSNCKTSCSRGCDPRSSLPPTELCTLRNTVLGRAAALKNLYQIILRTEYLSVTAA